MELDDHWLLVVDDPALAVLEQRFVDGPLPAHGVALAWHLRQRDTARAVSLARTLEPQCEDRHADLATLAARLQVVRAEALWLSAHLDAADALAAQALRCFQALADPRGECDALILLAAVATDRGQMTEVRERLGTALAIARLAGIADRVDWAEGALAYWSLTGDLPAAQAAWGEVMRSNQASRRPIGALWAWDFHGQELARTGRFAPSIAAFMEVRVRPLRCGQLRRAVNACTNVCAGYSNLNEHDAALEWIEQALELARPTGWPLSVGLCLMMMANTLRRLRRLDAAHAAIDEALVVLQALGRPRALASATLCAGELALDEGEPQRAAAAFRRLLAHAQEAGLPDIENEAHRGLAVALLRLGQAAPALEAATQARRLAAAEGSAARLSEALHVLGDIHAQHELPGPAGVASADASLHYLLAAVAEARTLEGFHTPAELWDALAREQARSGDHAGAYGTALKAIRARDEMRQRDATHRAIALEVRHETARAHAESERLREQAAEQARRAAMLHKANLTLERLSVIGREITAQREVGEIFGRIYQHLHALVDVQHLAIWLLGEPADTLHLEFSVEEGRRLPAASIALDSELSNAARCVRENREILIDTDPHRRDPSQMPGTLRTLSSLFAPLHVRGRTIGVLSIQAARRRAYAEREGHIFRTL
jgi:tetratricopeptide (TPR) repeat protein